MFLYSIQFNSVSKSGDKKVGRRGPEFSSFKQIVLTGKNGEDFLQ